MVADDYQATADTIQYSKRMLGHSYMSSNVDMTSIAEAFAGVPVESFVMRAAAKAFRAAVDSDAEVNVSKVVAHGSSMTYIGVQDLRVGQINSAGIENGPVPAG